MGDFIMDFQVQLIGKLGRQRRVQPYQPESNVVATATVNFGSTLISGAIPTEIGLLGALERLDFSHTRAEGHIPDVVGTPLQLLQANFFGNPSVAGPNWFILIAFVQWQTNAWYDMLLLDRGSSWRAN